MVSWPPFSDGAEARGSQISGATTALTLLQSQTPPKSIVMLEARELCSGATGRNAGHCKPDQVRGPVNLGCIYSPSVVARIPEVPEEVRDGAGAQGAPSQSSNAHILILLVDTGERAGDLGEDRRVREGEQRRL